MEAGPIPAIGHEMTAHPGLCASDLAALHSVYPLVRNHFDKIIEQIDQAIERAPRMEFPALNGEAPPALKALLLPWLKGFFLRDDVASHIQLGEALGQWFVQRRVPRPEAMGLILRLSDILSVWIENTKEFDRNTIQNVILKAFGADLIIISESYCVAYLQAVRDAEQREKEDLSQELAESERSEQLTIDQTSDLIVSLDQQGRILSFNRAAEELTGLVREQVLGRNFVELMDEPIRSNITKILQEEMRTKPSRHTMVEGPMAGRGGQKYYLRWHFTMPHARIFRNAAAVAVGHDLTEQKALAEKARKAERLAAVGTLANGLAHEIRNPLNGARLHLTFVERALKKLPIDAEVSDALLVVRDEINRLALLVDDFSEFARPMTLERGPRELAAICRESVDENSEAAAAAKANLIVDLCNSDVMIEADADKIKQALNNLIRNAIEAVAALSGGKVIVRARAHNSKEAIVEVEDDGIGLSGPDAPVFDAFYSTKAGGTGLGLAIVHRIVSDHGGSVGVESLPGRTIFWMTIPLSARAN